MKDRADRTNGHQDPNRLVGLVDSFCRHVYPAVFSQQEETSVSSPLAVWLLLAACASTPKGSRLEPVLGCSAAGASQPLSSFLADPPLALQTALAIWVTADDETPALEAWSAALPPAVETGALPSRKEVDVWAERRTYGLIKYFPMEMNSQTRLVLASALSTKISWKRPLTLVSSDDALKAGPWAGQVRQVLGDCGPKHHTMLATTRAAGVVAVHHRSSSQGDKLVARQAVMASYTQYGFEAAGISGVDLQTLGMTRPMEEGIQAAIRQRLAVPVFPAWRPEAAGGPSRQRRRHCRSGPAGGAAAGSRSRPAGPRPARIGARAACPSAGRRSAARFPLRPAELPSGSPGAAAPFRRIRLARRLHELRPMPPSEPLRPLTTPKAPRPTQPGTSLRSNRSW